MSASGREIILKSLLLGCVTFAAPVLAQQASAVTDGTERLIAERPVGARPDLIGLNPFSLNTRSPYGLLYPEIWRMPYDTDTGEGGWLASSAFEFGALTTSGDTDSASFQEYVDWDDGAILNRLWFLMEHPETGAYFKGAGAGVGRDDQSYRLAWGRYGKYELSGFFDSIPHVFSNNARVLWDGAGSGSLTLPAGLTPGGSTVDEVEAAFASIGFSTLALTREQYGLSFQVSPSRQMTLFANASTERRDGSRAFGGTLTYPFLGQVMETVEPIDYTTTIIDAGLQFVGQRQQFNFTYSGSLFQNDQQELTWENPGLSIFSPFTPAQGRHALAPDNEYHNLKADYGTNFDFWRGRFTATLSFSRMRQDEALLPHTISSGMLNPGGMSIDLDQWNVVEALSQPDADAAVDNRLGHLRLVLQPARKLRLTGEIRYRDEDNRTDYLALNPLTDQYGYIALDGGLADIIATRSAVFDPGLPGSRVRIRNIPYEKDELTAELRGDYRLASKSKLALSIRRSEFDYAHRERSSVNDTVYRIELNQRDLLRGSLRLGYEFLRRDGDEYMPNPYEPFYSSSLPGFTPILPEGQLPHTLESLRKFDLADRDSHAVDARFITVLTDAADLSLFARWEQDNMKADYGLRDAETLSVNAEWNYRPARNTNLFVYYAYQAHERNVANINNAGVLSTDGAAGGDLYPFENAWAEFIDEENQSVGGGFSRDFQHFSVDLQYAYSMSDSKFNYDFASTGAFSGVVDPAEVGSNFPAQTFTHHLFDASLHWFLTDDLGIRLFYRFEREDLDDFHYDGLTDPVVNDVVYLVAVPENFDVNIFGVLLEKSF